MINKGTTDIEKITTTLRNYSEAFKDWNYSKIVQAFHPDVSISYVEDGELNIRKPYSQWKEIFKKNKEKDPGIIYDINLEHIDHSNTIAFARMKWLIESQKIIEDTVDYLILMKFDSDWLIVNKMVHTRTILKD
ncbi:MAG: nuclear transport factor 2 family protein [Candidatus Hodarchaeota archaeon]